MRRTFSVALTLATYFLSVMVSASAGEAPRERRQGDQGVVSDAGWPPLMVAIFVGDREAARKLINAGADVNDGGAAGESPLYGAARSTEMLDVVKLLVERGADVNKKCRHNLTPLHVACGDGSVKVVEYLLSKGADPNAKEDTADFTPLHMAASSGWNPGRIDVIKLLLAHGVNINVLDRTGETAVDVAMYKDRVGLEKAIRALGGKSGKDVLPATKPIGASDASKSPPVAPATGPAVAPGPGGGATPG